MVYRIIKQDEMYHWGILGMKWGVRRYQNPDGTLTEAGKRHYARQEAFKEKVNEYKAKAAESISKKQEAEKAKRADINKRKQAAAERKRLVAMAKKHPDWLTDQELDSLNNRYNKENNFSKNYDKKKQKKQQSQEKKDIRKAFVSEVVTPAAVELGKAAVASAIAGGDFGKIATSRLTTRLFSMSDVNKNMRGENTKNNESNAGKNNNQKTKPQPKKTTGTFRKK